MENNKNKLLIAVTGYVGFFAKPENGRKGLNIHGLLNILELNSL